ncbi:MULTISPECIES: STAS domain-containing protein [Isoptericola]|uniref:STAS domain-containing protein n=1 Tax=Isoptericola TaxID=254250 RepID=UPI002712C30E|nr:MULTISPECIES: STAS domain-containing protein [unclassified Isoptericola]MDO8143471.1 STAS domain-containing protein [Isoptericola sp. 178]MDO8147332.1 STAS domain-containing protein [Isoptericola sp. b515]
MQDASNAAHPPDDGDGDKNAAPQIGDPASIHVIVGSSRARVVLSGEIDADVSSELGEAISDAEASGLPVEIDAHHVTFMDSSGVAFLARLASRSPHTVRILRAPPTVRFLLEVTRIGELLEIVDDDPGVDLDITSAQH